MVSVNPAVTQKKRERKKKTHQIYLSDPSTRGSLFMGGSQNLKPEMGEFEMSVYFKICLY
jgi:hypothetical protein